MYADPTLMDLAAAYAKRRNGRKTKHAVACDRPGAKAKMGLGTYKEGDRTVAVDGRKYEVLPYQVDFFLADLGKQDDAAWRASVVKHYLRKGYIKAIASRPGAKAKMGLLDRLGAAASALAGPGKDPTTQEYKTSVAEAKKAAIDEVKNYAFMVKQNDQKLAALDAYVKSTSKAIATLNSAPEILRLTDGLRQAVKARSVLLQTLKMPFGRDGAKASMARMDDATRRELRLFISRYVSNVKPADAERLMTAMYEKDPQHWEDQGFGKLAIAALGRNFSRPGAKAKSTHAALPPQTLEAERKPGGGSHSEAVSRKIATLINEGKPQDQAVAIALDLERRGEL